MVAKPWRFASCILIGAALTCRGGRAGQSTRPPERTVTMALDGVPLTGVVAELTRQSGVQHRAAGEEARRQLVIAYCRDRQASEIRAAITSLLGWRWSRSEKEGQPVYTLVKGVDLRKQE